MGRKGNLGARGDSIQGFPASMRFSIAFIISALVCMALVAVPRGDAFADVRKADVIVGSTVEQRDLPVADCPSIDAEYACLVGADGTVFFERNAHAPTQIASITKVMTAIVALENAKPDTFVSVSEDAALIGESTAGLVEGDTMSLDSALKALLVPSGNDAAQAIAETVGDQMIAADPSLGSDPVNVFVDAMNRKAAELGCSDTVYENPHGLDNDNFAGSLHSTASDQAKVAQYAMTKEQIRSIVGGGSTSIEIQRNGETEWIELETTDLLLDLYSKGIGIKTGFTDLAGPSFMGAANKDGFELYAVVLNSSDEGQRFYDAAALFEWVYDHVSLVPLANSSLSMTAEIDGQSRSVPVVAKVSHADWIDKTVSATLTDPDATVSVFDVDGNVNVSYEFDELRGDVHMGDKVGTATYSQRNTVVATQDLIACEDVSAPNIIDGAGIWWERLINGSDDSADQAETEIYNIMPIINSKVSNAA